jgi:hypothetical protein
VYKRQVGSLWRGTKGFLPRILPLVLLFALVFLVLYGLLIVALVGTSALGGGRDAAVGAVVLIFTLAIIVIIPLVIFLGIKLLYLVPVIGIEKLSSFAGMKRAWALTTGAFWRTFGYYLLAMLLVQAGSTVVSSFVQAGMMPALGGAGKADSLAELQAMFAALVPVYLISMAAQSLVQVMAMPFQNAYLAIMYLDQRRRQEEPAAPAPSYGWAPPPAAGGWQQGPPNPGWTPPPPPPPAWTPPPQPPSDDGRPGPS